MKALKHTLFVNLIRATTQADARVTRAEERAKAAINKAVGPEGVRKARLKLNRIRAERELVVYRAFLRTLEKGLADMRVKSEKEMGNVPSIEEVIEYVELEKMHSVAILLST